MTKPLFRRNHACSVLILPAAFVALLFFGVFAQTPPAAYGKVPNSRQVEWYHREMQLFLHFNMNTFTGLEWGTGRENPNSFSPAALDCGQWMRTAKKAGFKSLILVAKHHDGFCIWPSEQTTHDVASSSWRSGAGDVVREFTDSCRAYGLKPGIYLSCGDFHHDSLYPVPDYEEFYLNQTRELLNNYGTIWEMWWDGANNRMNARSFYRIADSIHAIQPLCAIWSDAAGRNRTAEMRWNGNEAATNGDPCWATMDSNWSNAASGSVNGPCYAPAEADVSIRDGWFYHSNDAIKPLATLITAYCNSVGRNGGLLLNVPPDTRGRINATDSIRLDSLGMWVYGTFGTNLAAGATVTSLHPRGAGFEPSNLIDSLESTYYATPDANLTDTITFDLGSTKTFDAIMVREMIALGQRTTGWSVDYSTNGTAWTPVSGASGKQSIGYKWIIRTAAAVTAMHVRLRITTGRACPALNTFGIYRQGYLRQPEVAVKGRSMPPRISTMADISMRLRGSTLILPESFRGKPVRIELYNPAGRLLQRSTAHGNRVTIADGNTFSNKVVLVKIVTDAQKAVQKVIIAQ